jgi:hypothetical protein
VLTQQDSLESNLMNPHRFSYSLIKAEIIRSVLAGNSIKEVAIKYQKSASNVSNMVRQAARRWHNLNFDLNLESIRVHSNEINSFISSYSIETEKEINVRLANKNLKLTVKASNSTRTDKAVRRKDQR